MNGLEFLFGRNLGILGVGELAPGCLACPLVRRAGDTGTSMFLGGQGSPERQGLLPTHLCAQNRCSVNVW